MTNLFEEVTNVAKPEGGRPCTARDKSADDIN